MSHENDLQMAMHQPGIDGNTGKMIWRVAVLSNHIRDQDKRIVALEAALKDERRKVWEEAAKMYDFDAKEAMQCGPMPCAELYERAKECRAKAKEGA